MTVTFQNAACQGSARVVSRAVPAADLKLSMTGKYPIAEHVNIAAASGVSKTEARGYLAAYMTRLELNPLRTKMVTTGVLTGAQEYIASWLARDCNKRGHYHTRRIPKMAAFGAFISAPLGHIFLRLSRKVFRGRTSLKAKIAQIVVSNIIIAPIQNVIYLIAVALTAGAQTHHQVRATVKASFWEVMRVTWLTSPICLAFAQMFLPKRLWVLYFNLVSFGLGIYTTTTAKKKRLAALRKKHICVEAAGASAPVGQDECSDFVPRPNHPC